MGDGNTGILARFLPLAAMCAIIGIPGATAGPQTFQTNFAAPCMPPDVNISTAGITRGVRSIDEVEFAAGNTAPLKRRTYEFDREGRLVAWTLLPLRGGREEWAKLSWDRGGRLTTFDSGAFDSSAKYQSGVRLRYDYDGPKLAKINRFRSAKRDVTAPVEPSDWQAQDFALVRQEKMPSGDVACLKVPVDGAAIALLEIVGQDGLYRQQLSLPLQMQTRSEELARRELTRLINDGVFRRDYPSETRVGWITLADGTKQVKTFSSIELTPNADYTKFDARGLISEAGVLRSTLEVNPQRKFEYRTDARGNWTDAAELGFKGQEWVPAKSYRRSIRYYE
jgi:hypothetical protein